MNWERGVEDNKELLIRLLEIEVEALRSVLSEFDQDKNCYSQMLKADAVRELLNFLKR